MYTFNIYLFLIALAVELNNLILNMLYLSKFFYSVNNYLNIKKQKKFNINSFFFKIHFIMNIVKEYIYVNQKIKS
jgi:hypothetical protein